MISSNEAAADYRVPLVLGVMRFDVSLEGATDSQSGR
jgi:hypothetical protein